VVRLPRHGKARKAKAVCAPDPTQGRMENKPWRGMFSRRHGVSKTTAAAMSAAVWGGNDPNDD